MELDLDCLESQHFSGKVQDYLHWKRVWQELMHPRMDVDVELFELRKCVPAEVKYKVKTLRDLDTVWSVLDKEYGSRDVRRRFTAQRMEDLHRFCYSKQAKTDGEKLLELHQVWREIYTDLQGIEMQENLSCPYTITCFVRKFPEEVFEEFVRFAMENHSEDKSESLLLDEFLVERARRESWLIEMGCYSEK